MWKLMSRTYKLSRRLSTNKYINNYCTGAAQGEASTHTALLKFIKSLILDKGAIPVGQYMKTCLTHPKYGYYTNKQTIIGQKGDFITSPEISQMFGELVACWCINEWMKCGLVRPFNIVELGPGKGTLTRDILRVCKQLQITSNVVIRLIELSPILANTQHDLLCTPGDTAPHTAADLYYKQGVSKDGIPIYWYSRIEDVPTGFSCYIAHEFFDALPIHQLKKTANGWREVLVDVDVDSGELRYVLSPTPTVACKVLLDPAESRSEVELCPEGGVIVDSISKRIIQHGGFSLIVDYGHSGEKGDTFRAFQDHGQVHPLKLPGLVDLTADVDFKYYTDILSDDCLTYGPVTQQYFLQNMGIDVRLQKLLDGASEEDKKQLTSAYKMLTEPDQMGEKFKFFSFFPNPFTPIHEMAPPAGFSPMPTM